MDEVKGKKEARHRVDWMHGIMGSLGQTAGCYPVTSLTIGTFFSLKGLYY